jgi:putative glycerol-1-phosphate prenyltransferase
MKRSFYDSLLTGKSAGEKKFAVLIDPDHLRLELLDQVLDNSIIAGVDYFFIGGSLVVNNKLDQCLLTIKAQCDIPLVLFPGNSYQLSSHADSILFLSLISGRNPDLLIGKHVLAAPYLKQSSLEIVPTGYMLIDGGVATTVSYISNTIPIPSDKDDIAICTAMAGEMLGMKMIYMDAGSGARKPISIPMIRNVSQSISIPLIVGGGISSPEKAAANIQAGADLIVVGNAIEKDPSLIIDISQAVHLEKAITR